MKKNYLFIGAAAIMMAGCASDDLVGDENISSGETPIGFNMQMPAATRADQQKGSAAASTLNYEFIVWGEKEESNTAATATTNNPNLVFENYRVQYKDNSGSTKNSTVSNTTGWDYVGIAPYAEAKVSPAISATSQTIKYWDFGKNNDGKSKVYTFTAVSALETDINADRVKITKNCDKTTKAEHGYTIVLKNGADASKIFVSDRNEVTATQPAAGQSMAAVEMAFRNFQTKIRFGFYETVPGYNVQITGVKYNSATTATDQKFGVDGKFITSPTADGESVTYTVTYDTNDKPVVDVAESNNTTTTHAGYYEKFGTNVFNKDLGKTSVDATFDQSSKDYTAILPNTGNETAMTFKVSYKLISEDTNEEIVITDRQVTVPAVYCQWKPNFAYTYLFKVSDTSAELYPITFDAVVEADEVSTQETITEVGEPSITTCAWDTQNKKVITDKDEYESGNVIYAATNTTDGMTSTNTVLYTATSTKGTGAAPVISEASVANCLANGKKNDENTPTVWTATDATQGKLEVTKAESSKYSFVTNEVPKEDNNGTRTINALKWTAEGNTNSETYYVVEYSYSSKKYYKVIKVAKTN